jgi:DNA invertase Pin-like site-specific DNA recombinase
MTLEQPLASLRFIVAARQSRKPRVGENIEFPIEAQDKRAREWGEAQGGEYVGTAADYKTGVAAPWNRKNTREWVSETGEKIHDYDAIVATKTDRISRGKDEDFSTIEAWAVRNQKKLIIVGPDGGIWYPARHDSDFWQWTATKRQARLEWEAIRERSMNRQADLQARGKLVGRPPFGYTPSGTKYDKTLIPTEVGREYVPQIFQRVADGQPLTKIARWLDSEGVKPNSKFGQKWSPRSIAQIIRNTVYVGQRRAYDVGRSKGVVLLEVEPIVDASLRLKANKRLDSAPLGRRSPSGKEQALLTGALRCGNCDAPMYRIRPTNTRKDGRKVVSEYYRCHGHLPQPKGCGVMVSVSLLDSIVDEEQRANHRWVFDWTFEPGEQFEIEAEIDQIRLKLRDLPTKGLPDDEEDGERARLRTDRHNLESRLRDATPDRWEKTMVTTEGGTPLTEADRWNAADSTGKREIIRDMRVTFAWSEDHTPVVTIAPLWATEDSAASPSDH